MSNLGTYTLREIWVNINAALRAYLVQKYYSILRRQRLPPSNRFKKLLVEVVGQITPAEPYKSTALTIFEITLPLLGVITLLSVLPNTYVTLATRRYYLHLENVLHVQKYTDFIYIYMLFYKIRFKRTLNFLNFAIEFRFENFKIWKFYSATMINFVHSITRQFLSLMELLIFDKYETILLLLIVWL